MADDQTAIRGWFDEGNERGVDFMLVVREGFSGETYPSYVDSHDETTGKAIEDVRDGGDRVMEVYDLKVPLTPQLVSERAWNTEAERELAADRIGFEEALVFRTTERSYVFDPAFTTERIDALTAGALANEDPAAHELEGVQRIMRKHIPTSLTEEIREAHPGTCGVEAAIADGNLAIIYPTASARELYEAGIPSRALIERAIERAEVFTEAPDELHAWRERNPLSSPVPEEVAAHRGAEYDRHSMGPDGFDGRMIAPPEFVAAARRRVEALAGQYPERADEIREEYRAAFAREATAALAEAYPDEPRMAVSTSGVGPGTT